MASEGLSVYEFGDGDEPVSIAVVEAVAEAAGVDPLEIEPLHSFVDPDALDRIFASTASGGYRADDVSLSFEMNQYEVTIWSYGRIHVAKR